MDSRFLITANKFQELRIFRSGPIPSMALISICVRWPPTLGPLPLSADVNPFKQGSQSHQSEHHPVQPVVFPFLLREGPRHKHTHTQIYEPALAHLHAYMSVQATTHRYSPLLTNSLPPSSPRNKLGYFAGTSQTEVPPHACSALIGQGWQQEERWWVISGCRPALLPGGLDFMWVTSNAICYLMCQTQKRASFVSSNSSSNISVVRENPKQSKSCYYRWIELAEVFPWFLTSMATTLRGSCCKMVVCVPSWLDAWGWTGVVVVCLLMSTTPLLGLMWIAQGHMLVYTAYTLEISWGSVDDNTNSELWQSDVDTHRQLKLINEKNGHDKKFLIPPSLIETTQGVFR